MTTDQHTQVDHHTFRRALKTSRTATLYRRARRTVERARRSSNARRLATAIERSRLAAAATWLTAATKRSSLYRWLTAEPDPQVIVIDLRETYTVGPIVALLDRIVMRVVPYWRASHLESSTHKLITLLEAAGRTRAGRTIAKLLEPPEPPEDET